VVLKYGAFTKVRPSYVDPIFKQELKKNVIETLEEYIQEI